MTELRSVGFWGTGSYLPERIMTNKELESIVDTSDEWIRTRTGIHERRIAADHEATSDLAFKAGEKALEHAGLSAEEIDLVIVGSCAFDMYLPATACLVAERLGAKKAAAFDVETACTSFIYGCAIGAQFIATGFYNKVLVIGAEVMSRIIDFQDRNTCVLFGDGAGAAVLGPVENGKGIRSIYLGADGSGGPSLLVPAGGTRLPHSLSTLEKREHFVRMNGSEVYKFAVKVMGDAALEALDRAGWKREDIDFFIPHQANQRIIDSSVKKLKIPMERVEVNLNRYGNMSAASIPVALDEAVRAGRIREGDRLMLVGFGAGLTWGSLAVHWAKPQK
ncbi:ketoacyl-ACP synthase III [Heliorestis acidaminivorans]|uniref:Beta-ketoacyl-[acyl-carrier-protein] synthase III n=2 Tax=Heliorestis acidaminivorans TaxID=553427 RepID=A0A6I0EY04_9FIRM|nr:beta-ketoacyl-ACP synthase III [Heliorestis acidaminivorans]KAB2954689.1 ketoacyl-ACP synthase III [Heliorestis acidaminivorans]